MALTQAEQKRLKELQALDPPAQDQPVQQPVIQPAQAGLAPEEQTRLAELQGFEAPIAESQQVQEPVGIPEPILPEGIEQPEMKAPQPIQAGVDIISGLNRLSPSQPTEEQAARLPGFLGDIASTFIPATFVARAITDKKGIQREIVRNVPRSAKQFGSDIFNAIRHPVQTGEAALRTVTGGVQLLLPGEQGNEQFARAFGDFIKDRYGGFDKARDTLAKDPVGFAADFSTFFTGIGGTISATGKISKVGQLQQIGKMLSNAGKLAEPIRIAQNTLRTSLGLITPKGVPRRMYERVLKLPAKMTQKQRQIIVETGLREGFIPTKSNLKELDSLITQITDEVDDAIVAATKRGAEIDMPRVFEAFNELEEFYRNVDTPQEFIDSINTYKQAVLEQRGTKLTPKQANTLKKNTQTLVRKHFGEFKGLQIEMRKALAAGLRMEIEKLNPDLIAIKNKRASELIELDKALNAAVGRISNQQIIGLKEQVAAIGAVQAQAAETRRGFLTFLASDLLMNNPRVNTALARALEKARTMPVKTGGMLGALGRQTIFQTGRAERELREPMPIGAQSTLTNNIQGVLRGQ